LLRQPDARYVGRDDQQLLPQQRFHLRRPAPARQAYLAGTGELLCRLRHRRVHQPCHRGMALSSVVRLLARGLGGRAHRLALELLHHGLVHLGWRGGAAALMPRRDWLEAGLIALAALVLYAVTAPRTVALEDDGLFVLGAYF